MEDIMGYSSDDNETIHTCKSDNINQNQYPKLIHVLNPFASPFIPSSPPIALPMSTQPESNENNSTQISSLTDSKIDKKVQFDCDPWDLIHKGNRHKNQHIPVNEEEEQLDNLEEFGIAI